MSDLSLKLQGTNGDLQEFDTLTVISYLYQLGLRLIVSQRPKLFITINQMVIKQFVYTY